VLPLLVRVDLRSRPGSRLLVFKPRGLTFQRSACPSGVQGRLRSIKNKTPVTDGLLEIGRVDGRRRSAAGTIPREAAPFRPVVHAVPPTKGGQGLVTGETARAAINRVAVKNAVHGTVLFLTIAFGVLCCDGGYHKCLGMETPRATMAHLFTF